MNSSFYLYTIETGKKWQRRENTKDFLQLRFYKMKSLFFFVGGKIRRMYAFHQNTNVNTFGF